MGIVIRSMTIRWSLFEPCSDAILLRSAVIQASGSASKSSSMWLLQLQILRKKLIEIAIDFFGQLLIPVTSCTGRTERKWWVNLELFSHSDVSLDMHLVRPSAYMAGSHWASEQKGRKFQLPSPPLVHPCIKRVTEISIVVFHLAIVRKMLAMILIVADQIAIARSKSGLERPRLASNLSRPWRS
ncbi:hypothetical protein AXF42_Ash010379 [Apostasia shenzhenica]|uniref:Uncharacterized protein n=1 Tax=Apostasia shenzhenica TaxID=1088818 RepID=A0A2I0BDV0_9ASPA|nr:hypothetical protein AXF42_Ash010379 [Apostasia shenzhenica]